MVLAVHIPSTITVSTPFRQYLGTSVLLLDTVLQSPAVIQDRLYPVLQVSLY